MIAFWINKRILDTRLAPHSLDFDMGGVATQSQPGATFRPLVAFDFDGTLTWRDSFRAFLAWRTGRVGYALGLARLSGALAAYAGDRDRGRLKAAMVREFLAGADADEVVRQAEQFATEKSASLFRPDAVKCFKQWRQRGARLVIVTASPEILVAPFAKGLGADCLIGTRLALSPEGELTGELDGANCRGPEKVARLTARFGPGFHLEAAYGDSDGDTEMLSVADERGLKVFGGRP